MDKPSVDLRIGGDRFHIERDSTTGETSISSMISR